MDTVILTTKLSLIGFYRWYFKPMKHWLGSVIMRYRKTQLGQAAGSLTFTTLMALVPLLTVMLAVFTAFPAFASFQVGLEKYFLQALIPSDIAAPVLKAVTLFASKAKGLGIMGLLILLLTGLALLITADKTLNSIWGVTQLKPWAQRLPIYALALTLGPLIVGMLFSFTTTVISATKGWGVSLLTQHRSLILDTLELSLVAATLTVFYKVIPNTWVRWQHAFIGGVFAAVILSLAKAVLGLYLQTIPSHSVIYGTFATLPILLLWIYLAWSIVLSGAVMTSMLSIFRLNKPHLWLEPGKTGWQFVLALNLVEQLAQFRNSARPERDLQELSELTQTTSVHCETVLERLMQWGWVVKAASNASRRSEYALVKSPEYLPMTQPVNEFLLAGEWQTPRMRTLFHPSITSVADWIRHTHKLISAAPRV